MPFRKDNLVHSADSYFDQYQPCEDKKAPGPLENPHRDDYKHANKLRGPSVLDEKDLANSTAKSRQGRVRFARLQSPP